MFIHPFNIAMVCVYFKHCSDGHIIMAITHNSLEISTFITFVTSCVICRCLKVHFVFCNPMVSV